MRFVRVVRNLFSRTAWIRLGVGYAAAVVAGTVVALAVHWSGGWDHGTRWDSSVLAWSHPSLPAWADSFLLSIPWLGTNITIFAVLIPYSIWLYRRKRLDIVAQLYAAAIGNYLLNPTIKAVFGRPRPSFWPRRGEYSWASYPSGHVLAMISVLLFGAWLLHRERGQIWAYIVWVPAFIAMTYSRLYLGVHWPTDVVGGAAMGVVWLVTLWLTFRRSDWRGPALAATATPSELPR